MTVCEDCGTYFPRLDSRSCGRCSRKTKASVSEHAEIDRIPQCESCGVCYRFLKGGSCSACLGTVAGTASVQASADKISAAADAKEPTASKVRFGNRAPKPGLDKAETLRHANKPISEVCIEAIVSYWPEGGGKSVPIQLDALIRTFNASEKVESAFEDLLKRLRVLYLKKLSQKPQLAWDFGSAEFSIRKGNQRLGSAIENLSISLAELVKNAKSNGILTIKEGERPKVPIRFTLREIELESDDSIDIVISSKHPRDQSDSPNKDNKKRKVNVVIPKFKGSTFRTLAHSDENDSSSSDEEPVLYQDFDFTRYYFTVDVYGKTKCISVGEWEKISVAKGWRRHVGSTDQPKGGLISYGWCKQAVKGRYNGQEYAIFQGIPVGSTRTGNKTDLFNELRILALGNYFLKMFNDRAEACNVKALLPKMRYNFEGAFVGELVLGLDFLREREAARPNSSGVHDFGPPPIKEQSLVFDHFLAIPFMDCTERKDRKEVKFCGSDDVLNGWTGWDAHVSAFIHATLVHSKGELLLSDVQGLITKPDEYPFSSEIIFFDPQAHSTIEGAMGHWDKGQEAINNYIEKHICNAICKKIYLGHGASDNFPTQSSPEPSSSRSTTATTPVADRRPPSGGPLRIGFP